MKDHGINSLHDVAQRYKLTEVYGHSVAYFQANGSTANAVPLSENIAFHQLILVTSGQIAFMVNNRRVFLSARQLIALSPFQQITGIEMSADAHAEGLLIDAPFFESMRSLDRETDVPMPQMPIYGQRTFLLDDERCTDFRQLLKQVRRALKQRHVYKQEILKSLLHVCLLFLNELPYEDRVLPHDFKHKENIFKIFIHLAYTHFRKERQIRFYAEKLNMTAAYLSRTVREISGSTVGEHLAILVYNEACNLLNSSEMSVGEISDYLHFSDQSAFTNFFKSKSGCSPLAFRNAEQPKNKAEKQP